MIKIRIEGLPEELKKIYHILNNIKIETANTSEYISI